MFAALDTIWVLLGAVLVFFMQAGFAMVETGFTRAKNAGNIIMKNLMDFAVGTLVFWAIGFGLMFAGWTSLSAAITASRSPRARSSSSRRCSAPPPPPLSPARWRRGPSSPRIWSTAW